MSKRHTRATGFTIVELLIVVVIIAILAAITLVTYNGIQQRATNTAIIDAASKSIRMIEAYIAANGAYPSKTGACITAQSGCADGDTPSVIVADSAAFDSAIQTVGTIPKSIASPGTHGIGIRYDYNAWRTFNGSTQPVVIQYFLLGQNQQCGIPNVAATSWSTPVSSSTGYYSSLQVDGVDKTQCIVSVQGPTS